MPSRNRSSQEGPLDPAATPGLGGPGESRVPHTDPGVGVPRLCSQREVTPQWPHTGLWGDNATRKERCLCSLPNDMCCTTSLSPAQPSSAYSYAVAWTCDPSYFAALSQLLCNVAEPRLQFEDDAPVSMSVSTTLRIVSQPRHEFPACLPADVPSCSARVVPQPQSRGWGG